MIRRMVVCPSCHGKRLPPPPAGSAGKKRFKASAHVCRRCKGVGEIPAPKKK